jgi:hypothetical protein
VLSFHLLTLHERRRSWPTSTVTAPPEHTQRSARLRIFNVLRETASWSFGSGLVGCCPSSVSYEQVRSKQGRKGSDLPHNPTMLHNSGPAAGASHRSKPYLNDDKAQQ